MRFFAVLICALSALAVAVEQEQPTPYDLIRPIWPLKWDTSSVDNGGTVESFSHFAPNKTKRNPVPPVGAVPQDFVPNGFVPDTLNTKIYDEVLPVKNEDAFAAGKAIAKAEGVLVGISSGAALHAAIELAKRPENKGKTSPCLRF